MAERFGAGARNFSVVTQSKYPLLLVGFVTLLVVTNIVAVKLISVGPLTVDGGVFLFPLIYVFGDVIAEVYGFKAAKRAIYLGFVMSVIATATILLVQFSPAAPEWENQQSYEAVLGFVPRIVIASLTAYAVGQLTNAWLLVRLRDSADKKTGVLSKLWFRLLSSTAAGQLLDTIVFSLIAFYGLLLGWTFWAYVALGYIIKVAAEVVLLPVTTRVISFIGSRERSLLEIQLRSIGQ